MIEREKLNILTAENLAVLPPQAFIKDITLEAKRATSRVWAQSMEIDFGPTAQQIWAVMKNAAASGLDTRLHMDAWTEMTTDGGNDKLSRFRSSTYQTLFEEKRRKKEENINALEDAGICIEVTNEPDSLKQWIPTLGRDHRKIFIIDDTVWFGGINLSEFILNADDFMVKFTDPQITRHLISLFHQINENLAPSDMEVSMTDDMLLLADCGNPGESIILETALKTAANAQESIFVTSQYVPDGKFRQTLHQAYDQNKKVEVVLPRDGEQTGVFRATDIAARLAMEVKDQYVPMSRAPGMVHAKLLIVDENTDHQAAMFGSHNYSGKGVVAGTAEAQILTTNPQLLRNLIRYKNDLAARSSRY